MTKNFAVALALTLACVPAVHAQDGSSCANAIPLAYPSSNKVDTTTATNWMTAFGPLGSPSNDIAYTFTTLPGGNLSAWIWATTANYPFALYLVPGCSDLGTQPVPIGATATLGQAITFFGDTETPGTYYLAVTGTAAGGGGANGTLTFEVFATPVTLQSFTVD
jgi:hypothetical protein